MRLDEIIVAFETPDDFDGAADPLPRLHTPLAPPVGSPKYARQGIALRLLCDRIDLGSPLK
jgi:hypothetical protein